MVNYSHITFFLFLCLFLILILLFSISTLQLHYYLLLKLYVKIILNHLIASRPSPSSPLSDGDWSFFVFLLFLLHVFKSNPVNRGLRFLHTHFFSHGIERPTYSKIDKNMKDKRKLMNEKCKNRMENENKT